MKKLNDGLVVLLRGNIKEYYWYRSLCRGVQPVLLMKEESETINHNF